MAQSQAPKRPNAVANRAAYPGLDGPQDWKQLNRTADHLTVSILGVPVTFNRTRVKDEGRYVTWFGTCPDIPGSSIVAVATPSGSYDAIALATTTNNGPGQFAYHTDAGSSVTTMTEANPGEEGCGVVLPGFSVQPDRTLAGPTYALTYTPKVSTPNVSAGSAAPASATSHGTALETSSTISGTPPTLEAVASPDVLNVGVLVLYEARTVTLASMSSSDPAGYIDGAAKANLESSNVLLTNSQVTSFQFAYLGAVQVPASYVSAPDPNQGGVDVLALEPAGVLGTWARDIREKYGADCLLYWRGDKHGAGTASYAGISETDPGNPETANYAVSVVLWDVSYKTWAHELAHEFGCEHDRITAENQAGIGTLTGAADGDGKYYYGQMFYFDPSSPYDGSWNRIGTYGSKTVSIGTVMSYADVIVPYFANPNITIDLNPSLYASNVPNGAFGTFAIGRPIGDPKAAYNAKVLQDNGPAMSALQATMVAPAITTQPAATTTSAGSSFSVSVTATGVSLSYQWSKNGTAIPGATSATFTVSSAATTDAGNYTVVVSNLAGSVTSDAASVTVNAAAPTPIPAPTPPPSSGGSPGGGGGAPSTWYLGAIAALAALRRATWRRRRRFPRSGGSR